MKLQAFVLFTILAVGCTDSPKSVAVQEASSARSGIQQPHDLSGVISTAKPIWSNPYLHDPSGPSLNWSLATNSGNGFDFLPHEQQLQLGGWTTPSGHEIDILRWLFSVRGFERATGRFPKNGQEVVDLYLTRLPEGSRPNLADMRAEELPAWYYEMVNPQTGMLYQSFDGTVVEPGGLQVREVVTKEDAVRAYNGRPGADLWGKTPGLIGGLEIIVSGKEPGSVLDTAVVTLRKDDGSAAKMLKEHWKKHPNG